MPRTILLDWDDTISATAALYDAVVEQVVDLLAGALPVPPREIRETFRLIHAERSARLPFDKRHFPEHLAMTYEALCDRAGRAPSAILKAAALAIGMSVYARQPDLVPGASDLLPWLAARYRVIVYTLGDPAVQRKRIAASGLSRHIEQAICVPEKTPERLRAAIAGHRLDVAWYLGNSPAHDMAPAIACGLRFILLRRPNWFSDSGAPLPEQAGRFWVAHGLDEARGIIEDQQQGDV